MISVSTPKRQDPRLEEDWSGLWQSARHHLWQLWRTVRTLGAFLFWTNKCLVRPCLLSLACHVRGVQDYSRACLLDGGWCCGSACDEVKCFFFFKENLLSPCSDVACSSSRLVCLERHLAWPHMAFTLCFHNNRPHSLIVCESMMTRMLSL